MRMMVTVRVPVQKGSATIKDGTLPRVIKSTLERIKPESAYFFLENGKRTMRAVFDMTNENEMVPAFEPLLMELDAEIELIAVMTADELAAGFGAMQ